MTEQRWRAFLLADELDDWVIVHGGPTAVFAVTSLHQAAQLASAIAALPNLDPRTILTAAADRLTVKLTREMWATEERHIHVARTISAVARQLGGVADPGAVQEIQVAISAKPAAIDLEFWRTVLGYDPLQDDNGVDPLGQGSTVWMQELDPVRSLRHAMHLDVSIGRTRAEARVRAAVAAGGSIVDDTAAPSAWILADRSGNKVCIAAWPDGGTPADAVLEKDTGAAPA